MNRIINFSFHQTERINTQALVQIAHAKNLVAHMQTVKHAKEHDYQTAYASLKLPFDTKMHSTVNVLVQEKQKLSPTVLVVIGIGGSALGAKAIHQAIRGRFYHATNPELRVYFVQTIDSDRIATIIAVLESELQKGNNVLINVVTKSGTTAETVVNFEVIVSILKKYRDDYTQLVVVTTDRDSLLWQRAQREQFSLLEIPKKVGGRYSVFSPVGLFPLALSGIDVDELLKGASAMQEHCLQSTVEQNYAALSALLLYVHYCAGITINDTFIFSVDLEATGKWYRQLMGESIGKEWNKHGEQVLTGITPTVSLGTIDLHSVAQLYLGGPRDKFTTFVTVAESNHAIIVPQEAPSYAKNKKLSDIMHAFLQGTQTAYKKNERPFCTVTLPEKNEYYLGQFLQFKMLEIMYVGYLLDVDPFDQPNVELYKQEVKKLL